MEAEKTKKQRTPGKIIAWIVTFVSVWFLLHNPTIFDAVLTFCLAGVVPGTGIVLSPNAVIAIVGGVLGFIVLLIVGIPIVRRAYRRRSRVALHPTEEQPATIAPDAPVVVHVEDTPISRTISPKPRHPLLIKLGVIGVLIRAKLRALLNMLGPKTKRVLSVVRIIAAHESKQLVSLARRVFKFVKANSITASAWIGKQLIAFWAWLKPQIHTFDAWLAKQVAPYGRKLAKRARKNDTFLLLRDIARGLRRELRPFSPFVLWGKYREEQQRSSQKDSE